MSVAFNFTKVHSTKASYHPPERSAKLSHMQEQISESAVRSLTHLQMSLQRQHFLLSYLEILSVGPAGV